MERHFSSDFRFLISILQTSDSELDDANPISGFSEKQLSKRTQLVFLHVALTAEKLNELKSFPWGDLYLQQTLY